MDFNKCFNYALTVLKKYADFSGRASRAEFWCFFLFYIIAEIILQILDSMLNTGGILLSIFVLAVFIPSIAVEVRRLHDIGKSGWWLLISLIPIVGIIVLLIWFIKDSQPGTNQYGPNPKEINNNIQES
jgi:uncharacterized membrane protein YhaH (DUF805 family)